MDKLISAIAQLLLISLPQNLSIIISIYAMNRKKIGGKKFWLCMLVSLAFIFVTRILPISFGIHTLLGMVVLIFLCVYYLRFPIKKTITAVFVTGIMIFIIEIISIKVITAIYGEAGFEKIMSNDLTNYIAGFPSSAVLLISTFVLYKILTKKIKRDENNGKNITQDS